MGEMEVEGCEGMDGEWVGLGENRYSLMYSGANVRFLQYSFTLQSTPLRLPTYF